MAKLSHQPQLELGLWRTLHGDAAYLFLPFALLPWLLYRTSVAVCVIDGVL